MTALRGVGLAAAAASTLLACKDDGTTTVEPVIDVPAADDVDATAAPLDSITLTVAHALSNNDLVSQTFSHGQSLVVPEVPFGDDLVIHMSGFVGQSSVAYGRTCATEVDAGQPVPEPHLFFSRSVKFATTTIAPVPRIGGLGISYLGTALLVGGSDGTNPVNIVERFDPVTGLLGQVGSVSPRAQSVQALIGTSPPRVVLIGGMSLAAATSMTGAKFVEVFDDQHIDRLDIPDMGRVGLTATALVDGRVIVIGGLPPPSGTPIGDINEVAQTDASVEERKLNATLAFPRSGHTATRLGDDVGAPVLIAGGIGTDGNPVPSPELFKPLSEELANPAMFAAEHMVVPRSGHTATLMPDGSVLFIGGLDVNHAPISTLELFSIDAGFTAVDASIPDGAGLVDFTATTLPDGRVLLAGGRATVGGPAVDTAYIVRLNSLDGMVDIVATDHLAIARAGHQALLLCDGTVLLSGGTPGQFPAERYNPPPAGRR